MTVRFTLFPAPILRAPARIATALITLALLGACAPDKSGPTAPDARTDASRNGLPFSEGLASPAWQKTARDFVAEAKFSPLASGRVYPILGVAQYLAVQRAEAAIGVSGGQASNSSSDGIGDGGRKRMEMDRGAVAGASVVVFAYIFENLLKTKPAQILEDMLAAQKNAGPGQSRPMTLAFEAGEAIGRTTGALIVARAKADKFDAANTAIPLVGDGYWISSSTPASKVAGGQLPGVTRWFPIETVDQFRPGAPPAFTSNDFKNALAEIKTMADTGNTEMKRIAGIWALNAGTMTAAGFWLEYGSNEIVAHGLSEREATHVFALTSATMFDAAISCWDAKLTYWLIRPWNANTSIVPLASMGTPPPNHPSYPSGHSCVSSSGAEVLSTFFPEKRAALEALVTEAGLSRMYGGIHYRFDIEAGQQLGRGVAHFTVNADASGLSVLTPR